LFNTDTDLLFPPRAIASLRAARGSAWKDLVDRTTSAGQDSPQQLAFILMMARLDGCGTCNADSFRALNGCTACSSQALKRYHGSDDELARLYAAALSEVESLSKKQVP
jgi:hypothetical protein